MAMSASKLILHHAPGFRSTRPLILYHELRVLYAEKVPPLQLITYDPATFRKEKTPEFLALNPNGKVPVLQHGAISMFEGCGICLYLLDQFDLDHKLAPETPEFRASLYQMAHYFAGTVDNVFATSSPVQRVEKDLFPGDDPAKVAMQKQAWVEIIGPYLSKCLADKPWFSGDRFSAVDVIVGYMLLVTQFKRPGFVEMFPNLERIADRYKEREAFQIAFGSSGRL